MRRGNRHLVGVVLGGRSGGSRDATMRNLLAENLDKGATKRTVAAITERNAGEANTEVAEADRSPPGRDRFRARCKSQPLPSPASTRCRPPARRPGKALADGGGRRRPAAPQAKPEQAKFEPQAKPEPAPLTSGVIQTQADRQSPARPSR